MLQLKISLKNLDKVLNQLDATGEVLNDLFPEMEKVGNYLVDFFSNAVFETEGGIIDESWAELSDKYEKWKNDHYPGRGVLERTGELRQGFEALPTSTYCVIQNDKDYGIFHEYGTDRMPARVFLKLDQERSTIIRDMIVESLNDRVAEAIK